jgi:hypothetical protein
MTYSRSDLETLTYGPHISEDMLSAYVEMFDAFPPDAPSVKCTVNVRHASAPTMCYEFRNWASACAFADIEIEKPGVRGIRFVARDVTGREVGSAYDDFNPYREPQS